MRRPKAPGDGDGDGDGGGDGCGNGSSRTKDSLSSSPPPPHPSLQPPRDPSSIRDGDYDDDDDDDDDDDVDNNNRSRKGLGRGPDVGPVHKKPHDPVPGHAKLKKRRRSRASVKPPLHVFPADASNFMAMVHQLTGIPAFPSPRGFHVPSSVPPSKSFPFMQGLPTLDTSSPLFLRRSQDYASNLPGAHNISGMGATSSQKQSNFTNSAEVDNFTNTESVYIPSSGDHGSCALPPTLWEASGDYYAIGRDYTLKEELPHNIKDEVNIVGTASLESLVSGHAPILDSWQSGLSSKKEFN